MKIVMLCDYPRPGHSGPVPTPIVNLVSGFQSRPDCQLDIVAFTRGLQQASCHDIAHNIRLHNLPAPKFSGISVAYLPRLIALRRLLKHLSPDVVHGQGSEAGYAWLAVWSGRAHVITLHGLLRVQYWQRSGLKFHSDLLRIVLEWVTLYRANHLIAISDFVARQVTGRKRMAVHRIFNAVASLTGTTDAVRANRVLLYAGQLAPFKGLADVLAILPELASPTEPLSLRIIGSPRNHERFVQDCQQTIAALPTYVSVVFTGYLDNQQVLTEMARATCVVVPSRSETFCMVAAEALSTGAPVAAYAIEPIKELIIDEVNGLLVSPADRDQLANQVRRLLTCPSLRARLGNRARLDSTRWRVESIVEQTLYCYQAAIGERCGQSVNS